MSEMLIVADDLSGAADCAAGCAVAGLETLVLLAPSPALAAAPGVVAVDVNSRNLSPEAAGLAMADAIRRMRDGRTRVTYHKIDSTLRGNWACELAHARRAVADLTGERALAVIAPAFPALGRTTRGGRVLIDGVPLEQTGMWNATGRTETPDLQAMLRHAGLSVRVLDVSELHHGPDHLARTLRQAFDSGADSVACDAETDQDLAFIAQGILSAGVPTVWSGSAGLMRQAALILGPGTGSVAAPAPARGPLLFVVGSASDVSHAQFELLAAEPGVVAIRVAPDILREPPGSSSLFDLESQLDSAIGLGSDIAALIERGSTFDARAGTQLVMALAAVVGPRLGWIGGLFATGGETARGLLEAAGATGIRLGGEIEPGVPWGTTIGKFALPIVTKAGAFGNSRTLLRCRNALKGVVA